MFTAGDRLGTARWFSWKPVCFRQPLGIERMMVLGLLAGFILHDICRDRSITRGRRIEAEKVAEAVAVSRNETKVHSRHRTMKPSIAPTPCKRRAYQLITLPLRRGQVSLGRSLPAYTVAHNPTTRGSRQGAHRSFSRGISGTTPHRRNLPTPTGRQYGPEIIQTGIDIGKEIYRYLLRHFKEEAHEERHPDRH